MKKILIGSVAAVVLIAGAGVVGFVAGRHKVGQGAATQEQASATEKATTAEAEPVASIQTKPLALGSIAEQLKVYGTVAAAASGQQTLAAPSEIKVTSLLVSAGQTVTADQDVIQIEPSPDTQLALLQAKSAVEAADKELANTKERYDLKLATNQELQQSQNGARDAHLKLENLQQRGIAGRQTVKAGRVGVVSKVDVTLGQLVPTGGALLEIDDQSQVEVRLGVDPADVLRLGQGRPVSMGLVGPGHGEGQGEAVEGKIRLITQRVSADTRLVDVLVSLPAETHWLIGSYVEAQVEVALKKEAMVVPRSAVLPREEGMSLFTVEDGHAVRHTVTLGLQNDTQAEVVKAEPPVKVGDAVVITGNAELDDKMAVKEMAQHE